MICYYSTSIELYVARHYDLKGMVYVGHGSTHLGAISACLRSISKELKVPKLPELI